jgi:glycosyltransferase involved in cell wall biosynthesis
MYDGVLRHNIPTEKVSMIPNMSKIDIFFRRPKDKELIKRLNLKEDSFKVVYFGAMGLANGMDYIIDALVHLKDREDMEFLFMGGGATEGVLKEKCRDLGIENAFFLGGFPLKELSEIVNLCDVSLVTFANIPILATNSPNKLFDSLSAGKPVIVNSPGWTKEMVEQHDCGFFVNPEDPMDLARKIVYLKENPDISERMGRNSRTLAETTYDKSILCKEFADQVDGIFSNLK